MKSIGLYELKTENGALSSAFLKQLVEISGAEAFLETGTYFGDTLAVASSIFSSVTSIELSQELYLRARQRFSERPNVELLHGNSAVLLARILSRPERPVDAVVWLDAHYSGEGTAKGEGNTPVLAELASILEHGCGTEIIVIDDVRMFGYLPVGFKSHEAIGQYPNFATVISALKSAVASYHCFVVGDILIAIPACFNRSYSLSPVVQATTALRMHPQGAEELTMLEQVVASATGSEKDFIISLPDTMKLQLEYGLGGDYCYWRGLVYEYAGRFDLAKQDFALALRCGVPMPHRIARKYES